MNELFYFTVKTRLLYGLLFLLVLMAIKSLNAQDVTHFKQNKSSFHGNLSATGIFYNSSGIINPRKPPSTFILSGNFTVNLKGFIFPFSFTFSNRNFDFRQPFNQFGISPRYKWITLHLGFRNISFDRYVLAGHTVLGAGIELNPGHFRFGFIYGRLRKKTNHAFNVNNPVSDTLNDYNRKLLSFKIGVGSARTFFDLIVLWAADDSTSLDATAKERGIYPATNLVAGINSRIAFTKTLHLEAEVAYSIYTLNQNSIIKVDMPEFVDKIIPINISSNGYMAIRGLLEYKNKKGLMFGLQYRRVDPGYMSMGAYFLNNDFENMTLKAGFRALQKKLRFNGSFGVERNNLRLSRNATTNKIIGSATLSYDPLRFFGITLNYSNYSVNQKPGRIQIADSVKLYQTNGTIMVMPHFQILSKNQKVSQFISYVFTRINLNDKNEYTAYSYDFITLNHIVSYNISFLPVSVSVLASFNYNKVLMDIGNSTNMGGTLGFTKGLWKNKISLSLNSNLTQSKNEQQTVMIITPSFVARGKFGKHHRVKFRFNIISTNNNTYLTSTMEEIGDLSYVFTF